jgi:transposase-like protein
MENNNIQIEEIRSTLIRLRQDPNTKRRFPREFWDSIIQLTKSYPIKEICRQLQINPAYLKDKMRESKEEFLEFREITMQGSLPLSNTITIELSTTAGLKAKIQGPIACMDSLCKLFGR